MSNHDSSAAITSDEFPRRASGGGVSERLKEKAPNWMKRMLGFSAMAGTAEVVRDEQTPDETASSFESNGDTPTIDNSDGSKSADEEFPTRSYFPKEVNELIEAGMPFPVLYGGPLYGEEAHRRAEEEKQRRIKAKADGPEARAEDGEASEPSRRAA